eukprot:1763756-Amphidinium_carterae.1
MSTSSRVGEQVVGHCRCQSLGLAGTGSLMGALSSSLTAKDGDMLGIFVGEANRQATAELFGLVVALKFWAAKWA